MSPRFPISGAPDESAKEIIEQSLREMHGGSLPSFKWIEDDGQSLAACYAPLCFSPVMTTRFFEMAKAAYYPTVVKPRNRELAILGLSSVLNTPYVAYCHRSVADKVGLTSQQYEAGLAGTVPLGLSEEEATAYRLGRHLTSLNGPLDDATWNEVTAKMEKTEVVGIVHVIGGYRWVALLDWVNGDHEKST